MALSPPRSLQPESVEAAKDEAVQDVSQDEIPDTAPKHNYLSAVRNSAKEGARQAAERQSLEEEQESTRRRRLLTAAGVAVACLAVAALLFRFHPGGHGVTKALSMAAAPHTARQLRAVAPRTPLDRLTELANKGDARAELVIGLKYLKGDGIAPNDVQAAQWLRTRGERRRSNCGKSSWSALSVRSWRQGRCRMGRCAGTQLRQHMAIAMR